MPLSNLTTSTKLNKKNLQIQKLPNSNIIYSIVNQIKRTPLPPPIIVRSVANFVNVRSELIDRVGPDSFTFKSTTNTLKIQSNNAEV